MFQLMKHVKLILKRYTPKRGKEGTIGEDQCPTKWQHPNGQMGVIKKRQGGQKSKLICPKPFA